jgi:hypothetical protein
MRFSAVGCPVQCDKKKVIHASINYIERNPVKAGLVEVGEEWPWSSARASIIGNGIVSDSDGIPFK